MYHMNLHASYSRFKVIIYKIICWLERMPSATKPIFILCSGLWMRLRYYHLGGWYPSTFPCPMLSELLSKHIAPSRTLLWGQKKRAWYTPFAPDQFPRRVWKVDTMPNFIPSITIVICCARYGGRWQCCHNSSMKHQLNCSGEQLCKYCCSSSTLNKPILYFD